MISLAATLAMCPCFCRLCRAWRSAPEKTARPCWPCRSALSIDEEVAAPPPPPPPVFDEAAVAAATRGLYTYIAHMLPSRDVAEEEKEYEEASDAVIATFTLRQEQIGPLKQLVQAKAAEEGKTPPHCSTVVVAYALAWVCHVRARGHPSHKTAHFGFTASCRGRLTPPAPDSYFGNCILPCIAEAKVEDLVGPDGFVAAAQAVGRAVDEFKSSDVMRCMERWREKIPAVMAEGAVVTVAGSPRFKVYNVDFGWGRPKKVDLMTIRKSRAISLADSREEEGGVEIGVVLPKSEMDEFGNHFISGLESNIGCKFDC
ncbi:phenolic glucoside malonyltransferase 2-like [Canna indica]|uniref:Phenolic glucoside malonyltransferase 2-like n=1 Tax=Canna indica TaxID=4628 RepID=A0AAQ3QCH3_9LILI|nr:phenolic glucoside malonyltransferase 2-like [Canna indica]